MALILIVMLTSLFGSAFLGLCTDMDVASVAAQEIQATATQPVTQDDDSKLGDEIFRASGRVVDDDGLPVSGALILAPQLDKVRSRSFISHRTDDLGRFELAFPIGRQNTGMLHTWFFAKGHGLRVAAMRAAFRDGKQIDGLEIPLPETQQTSFRVLLPDDSPCVNAIVRPYYVQIPNGTFMADEITGLSSGPPEQLLDRLSGLTDDNGLAVIDAIPSLFINTLAVESERFGRQLFVMDELPEQAQQTTLQLAEVGSVRGRVIMPNPERVAGTEATISTDDTDNSRTPRGIAVVQLDRQGRFEVPSIAAWPKLGITFAWDSTLDVQPVLRDSFKVLPAEVLRMDIPTRSVATVTGKVLTSDTRQPVVGARLSFRNSEALLGGSRATTDSTGAYSVRVPAGEIRQQLYSMGNSELMQRYDYPRLQPFDVPIDVERVDRETILVTPMRVITGRLQDASGDPLAGKTVALHSGQLRFLKGRAVTDRDGKFQMRVRDWDFSRRFFSDRAYWVIILSEAEGTSPPEFTRLTALTDDPDAMLLERQ